MCTTVCNNCADKKVFAKHAFNKYVELRGRRNGITITNDSPKSHRGRKRILK